MKAIREARKAPDGKCMMLSIRTDTSTNNLQHFMKLFELVKEDFPEIAEEEVRVDHWGTIGTPGHYLLIFFVPMSRKLPKKYHLVEETRLEMPP